MSYFKTLAKLLILSFFYLKVFLKLRKTSFDKITYDNKTVIICLTIWYLSYIPIFQFIIACYFKSIGREVIIVYDDKPRFTNLKNPKLQNFLIHILCKLLKNKFNIINLTSCNVSSCLSLDDEVIASFKSHYKTNNSYIGKSISTFQIDTLKFYTDLYFNFEYISKKYNDSLFIIPGGILSNFGILVNYLKRNNGNYLTYDSGISSETIFCKNGIAARLEDVCTFIEKNTEILSKNYKKIISINNNLIKKRRNGNDQLVAYSNIKYNNIQYDDDDFVLFMPNVSWDTAALGVDSLFESQDDWILESIKYILNNSKKNIVIRFHPSEKHFEKFSFSNILNELNYLTVKFENRLKIFYHYDLVDSYNLIKKSSLVVVHTSTVALEAIIMKKNIITPSCSYYIQAGLSSKPNSLESYFAFLLTSKPFTETDERIAHYCYILTQKYSRLISDVNPCFNFRKFINHNFNDIFKCNFFETLVSSTNQDYNSCFDSIYDDLS